MSSFGPADFGHEHFTGFLRVFYVLFMDIYGLLRVNYGGFTGGVRITYESRTFHVVLT